MARDASSALSPQTNSSSVEIGAPSVVLSLDGRVLARHDGSTLNVPTVYRQRRRVLERADAPIVGPTTPARSRRR
jgi:hypothetical protein